MLLVRWSVHRIVYCLFVIDYDSVSTHRQYRSMHSRRKFENFVFARIHVWWCRYWICLSFNLVKLDLLASIGMRYNCQITLAMVLMPFNTLVMKVIVFRPLLFQMRANRICRKACNKKIKFCERRNCAVRYKI